ncbi:MAG TPA: YdcF family protein [Acidimicrobiales bacterium]|nr:YdcF family protein [Acidimicrobiales bacterium]
MLLAPLKLALKILGVVLAVILVYVGVTFVQVWLTSRANDPHPADAILVFGTAANYLTPAPDLQGRLERALELYQAGLAPVVAVTGGKRPGDKYTEGQISATWLEGQPDGVPKHAIVVGSGADSWDNVGSVAPALRKRGVHTVLVVTDPFHEDRAMAIVSSYGFSPSPTPSEHSPIHGAEELGYLIKESVEVSVGRIIGYGTLSDLDHS